MPDRKFVRPRVSLELAEKIDAARGDVPFERWVRRALEQALPDASVFPVEAENLRETGSGEIVKDDPSKSASYVQKRPARASSPAPDPPSGAATAPSASGPGASSRKYLCPTAGCRWKGTNVPGGACPTHQIEAVLV